MIKKIIKLKNKKFKSISCLILNNEEKESKKE